MWGWGLVLIDVENESTTITPRDVEIGTDVHDFMERIDAENSVIYFHNLKFDGHFIIDWLLRAGYVWTGERKLIAGQFTTLISDMGKFYSMKVCLESGCTIEFRDSLKKLPMPVERIAKAFKLETLKGDIDYHAARPIGHHPTPEEQKYISHDVAIPATAIHTQFSQGMKRLTVGSDSLAEYKRTVGDKFFSRHFPVFSIAVDAEFRRAYRGGYTYADPRFAGREVGSGKVYDVNSLYPAVMYNELLPYGEPRRFEGYEEPTDTRPLTIFGIMFTAKLKPGHLPIIQIKGQSMFHPTEYLSDISEPTTLVVTNIDFALYQEHYDMEILAYLGGWSFKAKSGMFRDYIDKWNKVKENSEGGLREIAKLHLNSLYGKFASNPNVSSKYPVMDKDRVVYRRLDDEQRDPVYTPMGVFITSYARDLTIRAAQANYEVFAYADTDSLHLMMDSEPENLDIHPSRMGAWKHEYDYDAAFYVRAKAYIERHADTPANRAKGVKPGTYTNRIAGLPERLSGSLKLSDIRDGLSIAGKLTPKSVPGGIVLVDTPFMLKL